MATWIENGHPDFASQLPPGPDVAVSAAWRHQVSIRWRLKITLLVGQWDCVSSPDSDIEAASPRYGSQPDADWGHLCVGPVGTQAKARRDSGNSVGRHSASRTRCRRITFRIAERQLESEGDKCPPRNQAHPVGWWSCEDLRRRSKRSDIPSRQEGVAFAAGRCWGVPDMPNCPTVPAMA